MRCPGQAWRPAEPAEAGWSLEKLSVARRFFDRLPPASLMIVESGKVVAQWGEPARRIKVSSVRKSLINALFGIYRERGAIDIDRSLEALGIDDVPPLTAIERRATVRMLLQARSGVYHPYAGGTPAMRAAIPRRGQHAPGSTWAYNNWGFNVLGTIFEQCAGLSVGKAFAESIATTIGMEDFSEHDVYCTATDPARSNGWTSLHRAHHFRMSVRDLARFGHLFLCRGHWRKRQVVPPSWIAESTSVHSRLETGGYGYLWWIDAWPGFREPSYSARGALGKAVVVMPGRDLVFAFLNHAETPDDSHERDETHFQSIPTVTLETMGHLLELTLKAKVVRPSGVPHRSA